MASPLGDNPEAMRSGDSIHRPRRQSGDSMNLVRRQSGDSMHELNEVDPSPVDSDAGWDDPHTEPTQDEKRSTSALGLRDHGAIWWLTRVQRYSSYTFLGFLGLHITNTSLLPLATGSLPASDSYLLLTRPYYQSPLLEPLVVAAPILAHVGSGLALRLIRRRRALQWYSNTDPTASNILYTSAETRAEKRQVGWPRVTGTSALGFALTPLALSHAWINRGLPLRREGGSSSIGLGYVAHAFAAHPWAARVAYAALLGVASWHVAWGLATWWGLAPGPAGPVDSAERRRTRRARRWGINAAAAALAALWAAGGLGVVARGGKAAGWQGRQWDALYRQIPVLGRYW